MSEEEKTALQQKLISQFNEPVTLVEFYIKLCKEIKEIILSIVLTHNCELAILIFHHS